MNENIIAKGNVEIIKEWRDGKKEIDEIKNTILLTGRRALALSLANAIGDKFEFFITRMIFGDGGTTNGVKKFVNAGRNGLFGVTKLSKPVIATVDNSIPTQVIFTTVISFTEINGIVLNEMALQMATGDLFSMTTFPDLNKTSDIQLTLNWKNNFI